MNTPAPPSAARGPARPRRPRARPRTKMATAMYLEHYLDSKRSPRRRPRRALPAVQPRTPGPARGPRGSWGRWGGPGTRAGRERGWGARGGCGAGSRRRGRANSRCVTEGRGQRAAPPPRLGPLLPGRPRPCSAPPCSARLLPSLVSPAPPSSSPPRLGPSSRAWPLPYGAPPSWVRPLSTRLGSTLPWPRPIVTAPTLLPVPLPDRARPPWLGHAPFGHAPQPSRSRPRPPPRFWLGPPTALPQPQRMVGLAWGGGSLGLGSPESLLGGEPQLGHPQDGEAMLVWRVPRVTGLVEVSGPASWRLLLQASFCVSLLQDGPC